MSPHCPGCARLVRSRGNAESAKYRPLHLPNALLSRRCSRSQRVVGEPPAFDEPPPLVERRLLDAPPWVGAPRRPLSDGRYRRSSL